MVLTCVCVLISSLYKDTSHNGLGPTLMTSTLVLLFHTEILEVKTSAYEFWSDTIQPIIKGKADL